MKLFFLTFAFFYYTVLFGQNVSVLPVAQVHTDGKDVLLCNEGMKYNYECSLSVETTSEYNFHFQLSCYETDINKISSSRNLTLPKFELKKVGVKNLSRLVKNNVFINEETSKHGLINRRRLMWLKDNTFVYVEQYRVTSSKTWEVKQVELLHFEIIQLKGGELFGCFVEKYGSQYDIRGFFLIGDDSELIIIDSDNFKRSNQTPLSGFNYKKYIHSVSLYHTAINPDTEKYELKSSMDKGKVLLSSLDTVLLSKSFVICRNGQKYDVYDILLNKINFNGKIRVARNYMDNIQLIYDDQLKYLASDVHLSDTMPSSLENSVCGNMMVTERSIVEEDEREFKYIERYSGFPNNEEVYLDTMLFRLEEGVTGLRFLNGESSIITSRSWNNITKFGFNEDWIIGEKGGSVILMRIEDTDNTRHAKSSTFFMHDENKQNKTNINLQLSTIGIFPWTSVIVSGCENPIEFYQGDLRSYYPLRTVANYIELSEFIGVFAKYKKLSGEVGWIDIDGNEYPSRLN